MATIEFTTNLPLSRNPICPKPWQFDPKYFDSIPDEAGVYIVGVKINVDGQGEKFCPLYVGIKNNIRE